MADETTKKSPALVTVSKPGKIQDQNREQGSPPANDCQQHVPIVRITGTPNRLIPAGEYEATCTHYETHSMFNGKVFYWFQLISDNPELHKVKLYKPYNATLIGKPGKFGSFTVSRRTNFFKDYERLFGYQYEQNDLDPMDLIGKCFQVQIGTTRKSHGKKALPETEWYSVVREISKSFFNS